MNKRRIVKEIMDPYMDKNGFILAKYERGDWYYRKEIEGAVLEICISDANGRLHMHIGCAGRAVYGYFDCPEDKRMGLGLLPEGNGRKEGESI